MESHDLEKSDVEEEYPDPELYAQMMACPDNQLGLDASQSFYVPRFLNHPSEYESESEDSDPIILSGSEAVTLCRFSNIKEVIASKSNYNGGRFSSYLEDQFGCIVIPLSAVSKLRLPVGDHKNDPHAIVFIPPKGPDHTLYANFSEAAETFYKIDHPDEDEGDEEGKK